MGILYLFIDFFVQWKNKTRHQIMPDLNTGIYLFRSVHHRSDWTRMRTFKHIVSTALNTINLIGHLFVWKAIPSVVNSFTRQKKSVSTENKHCSRLTT